jgi:hypothetical protein
MSLKKLSENIAVNNKEFRQQKTIWNLVQRITGRLTFNKEAA